MIKKRTTIYLEDKIAKMLKLRSIKTNQSVSDYISRTVYLDMIEEQSDIKDIEKIAKEPTMSFDKMIDRLGIKDEV